MDVENLVKNFPLIYAIDHLPADKKPLSADADFVHRLENYLKKPSAGDRQSLQTQSPSCHCLAWCHPTNSAPR